VANFTGFPIRDYYPVWGERATPIAVYTASSFSFVRDRLRDCMLMLIVSAQAFESLIPPQTKQQAEVLALNLKNLVMYRAASELDALRCANALGKDWVERATRTVLRTTPPTHTSAWRNFGSNRTSSETTRPHCSRVPLYERIQKS
jgi:hypothetical protein